MWLSGDRAEGRVWEGDFALLSNSGFQAAPSICWLIHLLGPWNPPLDPLNLMVARKEIALRSYAHSWQPWSRGDEHAFRLSVHEKWVHGLTLVPVSWEHKLAVCIERRRNLFGEHLASLCHGAQLQIQLESPKTYCSALNIEYTQYLLFKKINVVRGLCVEAFFPYPWKEKPCFSCQLWMPHPSTWRKLELQFSG